ncbi:HAD-IC family P-type ATPase [Candidatus Phytoplasma oryzae]|nr:HAD-IC family P-type ATPase [Candidatus Phytoplasma oryzae]
MIDFLLKEQKNEKEKNEPIDFITDIKGLTSEEVYKKEKEKKYNITNKSTNKSYKDIIFNNLFNFLNLIVLIVAFVVIISKHYEQLFFLFINLVNLLISIIQEIKVKKTLDKISLLNFQNTKVIRDSKINSIPINKILTGDIIFLELGSQIVADAKIKKGTIEVNESLLTGESKTIFKKEGDFLYSGSFVISGNAVAEVLYIGSDMFISKITQEAKKYKRIKTPLTQIFYHLIFFITILIIPMSCILFFSMKPLYLTSKNEVLLGLAGFMLSLMPSGLFLLTSITLAVGFVKLAQKNAYIKDLFGIEMLARINFLCLDKTGTITNGNMLVKEIIRYKDNDLFEPRLISEIITAFPNNNPTQKALNEKFCSLKKNDSFYKINKIQSFSSERKYSAIEIDKIGTFLLGSPEFILKEKINSIKKDIEKNAILGYRVLVLVQTDKKISQINDNNEYKIISLIILEDQIKSDVIKTIQYFKENNVKIKIISGDNPLTIGYIAYRLGIIKNKKEVLDLSNLSNKEIDKKVIKYNVFGRSSPEQKKRIIFNLKKNGLKVAMIGDGVNDILAFKESDISISMAAGSEAAKNASNLVLIDSKFSSLPKVVSEGRRVINNLRKISVSFFIKTIISFLVGIITILNNFFSSNLIIFPFTPLQFNLIDTFFIGIPSFFLALEPNTKKIEENFLINIFIKALPYSFCVAFNYFLLLFTLDSTKEYFIPFFITIIASFFFFLSLIKNCLPFNKKKIILVLIMLFGFFNLSYFLFFKKIFQSENISLFLFNNYQFFVFLFFFNIFFIFLDIYFLKYKK